MVKNSPVNEGDGRLDPWVRKILGEGNVNPRQWVGKILPGKKSFGKDLPGKKSFLAWKISWTEAMVHGVAKIWTQLNG